MQCPRLTFLTFAALLVVACAPSSRSDGDDPDDPDNCDFGEQACGGECVDTGSDPQNCGGCGIPCDGTCTAGICLERCEPGTSEACYGGPPGTENVGLCKGGTRVCGSGGTWGACDGEVLPGTEDCSNGIDDNCSGEADESVDIDQDGYTTCDGDCCDSTSGGCDKPELVNPGAIDVAGNSLDDDCDGTKDNVLGTMCDTGLASNSGTAMDYAKAMELCQVADVNASGRDKKWGVVSARFTLPSGTGDVFAAARSIRTGFGASTVQAGASLAVLSTGVAADANDTNPNFVAFQLGSAHTSSGLPFPITSAPPADWVAANGNDFPNAPGCPPIDTTFGLMVNDPVMLELKVRVPSNAKSFSFSSNFFSAEYPEYVCSPFNDFFVVLLDSTYAGTPANPTDKNLAIYKAPGGQTYPVGVNLASGDTGLFRECKNGPTGCAADSVAGTTTVCTGTAGLVGTGFDTLDPPGIGGENGFCGASNMLGGGTGWLETSGNVVGGETITLRIAIWDTSDAQFDSIVLLDNFEWSLEAAQPGTVIE